MTEQNQAQDLLATLRDALHQLEGTLERRAMGSARSPARPNASGRGSQRWADSGCVRIPRSDLTCSSTLRWICSRPCEHSNRGSSTCRPM